MKKIVYLLPFLFVQNVFSVDSITSGLAGFLKPSTGIVDTSRSFVDKYNVNWDIADATMTEALRNSRNPIVFSTNIVDGQVKGIDIAAGTIASSHTIPGQLVLNGLNVIAPSMTVTESTWTVGSLTVRSSMTVLSSTIGTANYDLIFASAPGAGQALAALSITGRNVVIGGVNMPAGGVSTVQTSSATIAFDVVVGTLNALNVDVSSNNEFGLQEAIRRINGSSTAVNGKGGSILYRSGFYTMGSATIPANIHVYAVFGSSVIWFSSNTILTSSYPVITNYGIVEGVTVEGGGQTSYPVFNLKNSSGQASWLGTPSNPVNFRNFSFSGVKGAFWQIEDSTNVRVYSSADNYNATSLSALYGDTNPFRIIRSSDFVVVQETGKIVGLLTQTNGGGGFYINSSGRGDIQFKSEQVGADWLVFDGKCRDIKISKFYMRIIADNDGSGTVYWNGTGGGNSSSSTIVENGYIDVSVNSTQPIFKVAATDGGSRHVLRNISAIANITTSMVFLNIGGLASAGVHCTDNSFQDNGSGAIVWLSDSGTATKCTNATNGYGNILNNTAQ